MQETRHGAHTGSSTERRSRVPVSEGSSARKVDRASKSEGYKISMPCGRTEFKQKLKG